MQAHANKFKQTEANLSKCKQTQAKAITCKQMQTKCNQIQANASNIEQGELR